MREDFRGLAAVLVFFYTPLIVHADGIPIDEGRFIGGKTTVITLTEGQVNTLVQAEKLGKPKRVSLSEHQRWSLQETAGSAPVMLFVYNTRTGENDCTCEAQNLGLWFDVGLIEVPHTYLVAEGVPPPRPSNSHQWLIVMVIALFASIGGSFAIHRLRAPI